MKKTLERLGDWVTAERVGGCGGKLVLECPGCGGRHVAPFFCGHRACGRCAAIQRWRKVQKLWPLVKTFKHPRFLTLTFKNRHRLSVEWRREQFAIFRKFLKNREVAKRLGGGVWCWEVTYNQVTKMWHPHFHLIFDGEYIPKAQLKGLWHQLTGDSFILKIQEIIPKELREQMDRGEIPERPPTEEEKLAALRETVKYITKAVAFVEDEDLLVEFLEGTKGMRRFGLFGKCHGYKPPKPPPTDKRFWHINPFTGRGPRPIGCECGYEALPEMFRMINRRGCLYDDDVAAWLARTRGDPDPRLMKAGLEDMKTRGLLRDQDEESRRELTPEELFNAPW